MVSLPLAPMNKNVSDKRFLWKDSSWWFFCQQNSWLVQMRACLSILCCRKNSCLKEEETIGADGLAVAWKKFVFLNLNQWNLLKCLKKAKPKITARHSSAPPSLPSLPPPVWGVMHYHIFSQVMQSTFCNHSLIIIRLSFRYIIIMFIIKINYN